jgi:glycosyltransferase involved in cell wall biosynthesis
MRIAQIAPLYESVPPKYYGGTERVVSYLTEELVSMGHEVTLFASGDSETKAKLIPVCSRSLRLDSTCIDTLGYHILMIERLFKNHKDFDIIHSHIDYLPFSLIRRYGDIVPVVTTLHGRLDLKDIKPLHREFSDIPLISISNAQQKPLSWANWQGTVYHGLPSKLYVYREETGQYLAFLGRVSPEKGLDKAIEIAKQANMPLKIAAKVDKADEKYFEEEIRHLLDHPLVEFIGEIGEAEKSEFFGNATALLFPIDWPEPFGLVMIESMACGTPVIATPCGSVPEIIEDGVNGFIVHGVAEAVKAIFKLSTISRKQCREVFEERFSARRMATRYLQIYKEAIHKRTEGATLIEEKYEENYPN